MRQSFVLGALAALALGCSEKEVPRVRGPLVLSTASKELWPAPGGQVVATLAEASPATERGAPPDLLLGGLTLVPVGGGQPRRLGGAVSNLPGSVVFSKDGSHVAFLAGYSVRNAVGELRLAKTGGSEEPEVLAPNVSFFAFSPEGDSLAWVSDGHLFVRPLAGGAAKEVTEGVSLVQFGAPGTPAAGKMLVKRSVRVDGALLAYDLASGKLTALARGVGAFGWSPGGDELAFQASALLPASAIEPGSKFAKGADEEAPGLYLQLATAPPKRVSSDGASEFKFSPKGHRLAFVTPPSGGNATGDLYTVDGGGVPTKVATRVAQFVFAPDGSLALLGAYDRSSSAGTLGVLPLEGTLVEVARSVRQFSITPKGRYLLFLHGVVKNTTYSLGLSVHRLGAPAGEKPREIDNGVAGYLVDEAERHLAYKARCIDEGKTCTLFLADLDQAGTATSLAPRVTAFEFVPGLDELVVVASRPAAKLSGKLLFSLGTLPEEVPAGAKSAPVTVLDDEVTGEFALVGPEHRQVAYLVDAKDRAGVGVVPLPAPGRATASP